LSISPYRSCFRVNSSPALSFIVDPLILAALLLILTLSSSFPFSIAKIAVIILVVLAIALLKSAFLA
jgi:hypothetical protein